MSIELALASVPKQFTMNAAALASMMALVKWNDDMPEEVRMLIHHRTIDEIHMMICDTFHECVNEKFKDLDICLNSPGYNTEGVFGAWITIDDAEDEDEHFVPVIVE